MRDDDQMSLFDMFDDDNSMFLSTDTEIIDRNADLETQLKNIKHDLSTLESEDEEAETEKEEDKVDKEDKQEDISQNFVQNSKIQESEITESGIQNSQIHESGISESENQKSVLQESKIEEEAHTETNNFEQKGMRGMVMEVKAPFANFNTGDKVGLISYNQDSEGIVRILISTNTGSLLSLIYASLDEFKMYF